MRSGGTLYQLPAHVIILPVARSNSSIQEIGKEEESQNKEKDKEFHHDN